MSEKNSQTTEQLSNIFRAIEEERGSIKLAEFVMESLETTLDAIKINDIDNLYRQFNQLFEAIRNTQPRISLVIYYFFDLWEELEKNKPNIKSIEEFKKVIIRTTKRIQEDSERDFKDIVKIGAELVNDNDVVLVHSHSLTVREVLATAARKGKKFRVIIAEQETDKTIAMVDFFTNAMIPFTVVPEYMLSHISENVTKVFFGATTLDQEQQFICDAGSYSVLAEFHAEEIPNYMFLSTKKFSLWQTSKKHETYKTTQNRIYSTTKKILNYERIKFSHDRVPAELFNSIVTEIGIMTPDKIKEIYLTRYEKQEEIRQKFFSKNDEAIDF